MAGDCHLLDNFNSKGWRLHPYDATFQYIHHDVFVKGFCVEGMRSTKRRHGYGDPYSLQRNESTIDVAVNMAVLEQIPAAMDRLNRYTVNEMVEFHKSNYERFKRGDKCVQRLPCLKNTLYVDAHDSWLEFHEKHDFTQRARIVQLQSKYKM